MSDDEESTSEIHDLNKAAKDNIVTLYMNDFSEASAKEFSESFSKAIESKQGLIPIIIDSSGGSAFSLLHILDLIKTAPVPVATIAIGKAMSAGSLLLAAGTKGYRFAAPNSVVMIHEMSAGTWGTNSEIQSDAKHFDHLNKLIMHGLDKNCERSEGYFFNLLKENKNADLYFTGEECKEHGIVDHVKVPKLKVSVTTKTELV